MQHTIRTICLFLISFIFQCNGVSLRKQLEHIAKKRLESLGITNVMAPSRRYEFDPRELSQILGVPSRPSHLPEAESILPGHTLNRPALGMLKSSLKFPHKELEDGAGVYGSYDNIGIKYDARNERVLYTGFRRFPSDFIMIIPTTSGVNKEKPSFKVVSTVLDLERKDRVKNQLLDVIKKLNNPAIKGSVKVYLEDLNNKILNEVVTPKKIKTSQSLKKHTNDDYNLHEKKPALRNANLTTIPQQLLKGSSSAEHDFDSSDAEKQNKSKKLQWLYNSKDSYNHIKIDQDAPDLNELVPPLENEENIQQWWFYSADDSKEFS